MIDISKNVALLCESKINQVTSVSLVVAFLTDPDSVQTERWVIFTKFEKNLQVSMNNSQGCENLEVGGSSGVHVCPDCGLDFRWPSRLKQHLLKHTGDKPFVCGQCGASFTQAGSARRHQRICGTKEYKCSICKVMLPNHQALLKHSCWGPSSLPPVQQQEQDPEQEEEEEGNKIMHSSAISTGTGEQC